MDAYSQACLIVAAWSEPKWAVVEDEPVRSSNGAWYPWCDGCKSLLATTGRMAGCGRVANGIAH
jgi:hypothetical protein